VEGGALPPPVSLSDRAINAKSKGNWYQLRLKTVPAENPQ